MLINRIESEENQDEKKNWKYFIDDLSSGWYFGDSWRAGGCSGEDKAEPDVCDYAGRAEKAADFAEYTEKWNCYMDVVSKKCSLRLKERPRDSEKARHSHHTGTAAL